MVISDEPETQWDRLEYALGNGVGDLVASPLDWPGPNAARAFVHDEPLVGHWFNRTQEWQLPAFQHLRPEEYRQRVADLIGRIERDAAAARAEDPEKEGRPVPGPAWVLSQDPHKRPEKIKKSPAPKLFYASDPAKSDRMRDEYDLFEADYYFAADRLDALTRLPGRANPAHEFPIGCFPRGLPFIGAPPIPMPKTPPSREIQRSSEDENKIVFRGEVPTVRVPRVPVTAGGAAAGTARASPAGA